MRSVILLCTGFVLMGLLWAVQAPLGAYGLVQGLSDPGAGGLAAGQALLHGGAAAIPALHNGLLSPTLTVRLRCARILALRNDPAGELALLEILRTHGAADDPAGAAAEVYLVSLWDRASPVFARAPENRESPNADGAATRALLAQYEAAHADANLIALLTECLSRDPVWIGGYVRRAHANLRAGEVWEARRDALLALALDYNEFEAAAVLAQASLLLNAPQEACTCLEQALRVNPRLARELHDDIRDVLKALDAEKVRQRREKRRETPDV